MVIPIGRFLCLNLLALVPCSLPALGSELVYTQDAAGRYLSLAVS